MTDITTINEDVVVQRIIDIINTNDIALKQSEYGNWYFDFPNKFNIYLRKKPISGWFRKRKAIVSCWYISIVVHKNNYVYTYELPIDKVSKDLMAQFNELLSELHDKKVKQRIEAQKQQKQNALKDALDMLEIKD